MTYPHRPHSTFVHRAGVGLLVCALGLAPAACNMFASMAEDGQEATKTLRALAGR